MVLPTAGPENWLEPPLLMPTTSYTPAGTAGPGQLPEPGVHVTWVHEYVEVCDQLAGTTVGPVKVDAHPVEIGAAVDHTKVPDELSTSTRGHA